MVTIVVWAMPSHRVLPRVFILMAISPIELLIRATTEARGSSQQGEARIMSAERTMARLLRVAIKYGELTSRGIADIPHMKQNRNCNGRLILVTSSSEQATFERRPQHVSHP